MFSSLLSDLKTLATEISTTAYEAANELSIAANDTINEVKIKANDTINKLETQYKIYNNDTDVNNTNTLYYIWQHDKKHIYNTLKSRILQLSQNDNTCNTHANNNDNTTIPPFDYNKYEIYINNILQQDTRLHTQYQQYVPSKLDKNTFWTNYISHVEAIRHELNIDYIINKPDNITSNTLLPTAKPIQQQPSNVVIPVGTSATAATTNTTTSSTATSTDTASTDNATNNTTVQSSTTTNNNSNNSANKDTKLQDNNVTKVNETTANNSQAVSHTNKNLSSESKYNNDNETSLTSNTNTNTNNHTTTVMPTASDDNDDLSDLERELRELGDDDDVNNNESLEDIDISELE